MKYICRKRARFESLSGDVNIPYGCALENRSGMLYWNSQPVCIIGSQNADNFVSDADGRGLERAELINAILKSTEKNSELWDKIFSDNICKKYRRADIQDRWIWSANFFSANIFDLQYIGRIINE